MSFIEKLEMLMEARGIKNLNVLSEKSEIPYMTLKNFYIKGTDNIKLSTLNKLKVFFDVTLDYLMEDTVLEMRCVEGFNSSTKLEENINVTKIHQALRLDEQELLNDYNSLSDGNKLVARSLVKTLVETTVTSLNQKENA